MTTSDPSPEPVPSTQLSAFGRAENASRRILLVICAGVLAWGVGSILSVNLREALEAPLEAAVLTGLGAIVEHWVFQHLWLVVMLVPASWLGGRFLGGSSLGFVLPAAISGEVLALAIAYMRDGSPFFSWEDVGGWAISLGLALVPCFFAFAAGGKAFERARQQSLRDAAERKSEYDAFIAKSANEPPASEPPKPT
ncbi:MAG: hypothetical protein Q8S33_17130 [Myxococcales bacterium]|nr:hypothetical protein [Myxococcales bacterium]MDP3502063.1 hypothetical protein [Myxococcales bacterium]